MEINIIYDYSASNLEQFNTIYNIIKDNNLKINKFIFKCDSSNQNDQINFLNEIKNFLNQEFNFIIDNSIKISLRFYNTYIKKSDFENYDENILSLITFNYIAEKNTLNNFDFINEVNSQIKYTYIYDLSQDVYSLISEITFLKNKTNDKIRLIPLDKSITFDMLQKFQYLNEYFKGDSQIQFNNLENISDTIELNILEENFYINNLNIVQYKNIQPYLLKQYILEAIHNTDANKNIYFPNGFLSFFNQLSDIQKLTIKNYLNFTYKDKERNITIKDYYKIKLPEGEDILWD